MTAEATRRDFERRADRLRFELHKARERGEPVPSAVQVESFLAWRRAHLLGLLAQARTTSWFELFNPRAGLPVERQPAYLKAESTASYILERALSLVNEVPGDLDLRAVLEYLEDGYVLEYDEDTVEEVARQAEELPELTGTAQLGWTAEETADLLLLVLDSWDGGHTHTMIRDELRAHIARKIWDQERRLELFRIDKATACAFIEKHHSALPTCNTRGLLFALGAFFEGNLVAVATAGTPTGRWGSSPCPVDGILELTRIASVGGLTRTDRRGRVVPVNASSALAARMIDLLPLSGRRGAQGCRFVTYSMAREHGTTYLSLVSKGLRPVGTVRGKAPTGARKSSRKGLADLDKIVWEAGPAARAPNWQLVAPERREGAVRAFAHHSVAA